MNKLATELLEQNPELVEEILDYIRFGRGYGDPTDLFDNVGIPEDGLYSFEGAIALMDAAWKIK